MPEQRSAKALLVLCALGVLYVFAVLPLLSFRHDDWWILGNSVRYLPLDWNFLWRPTLYFNGHEIIWFFRPGFKLLVFVFYACFGLHYGLWMFALLLLFLAALWIAFLAVSKVSGSKNSALWFLGTMAASFTLHLGSLAWMGEGMMNVPQFFLLSLCTLAFCNGAGERGVLWSVLSRLSFVGALCFKESSLFHVALLAGLLGAEPYFRRENLAKTFAPLIPFCFLSVFYLAIRLGYMPYNPGYVAVHTLKKTLYSAFAVIGPICLPMIVWSLGVWFLKPDQLIRYRTSLARGIWYLPFVAVSLALYIGQDFFSPGWLLVVGGFTMFWLALRAIPENISDDYILRYCAVLFLISSGPVVYKLNEVGWWKWHTAQNEVFDRIRSAPKDTKHIFVRGCENPQYPGVVFERVVANEEGMRQMFFLSHQSEVSVQLVECNASIQSNPDSLVLTWRFPRLI